MRVPVPGVWATGRGRSSAPVPMARRDQGSDHAHGSQRPWGPQLGNRVGMGAGGQSGEPPGLTVAPTPARPRQDRAARAGRAGEAQPEGALGPLSGNTDDTYGLP